MDLRFAESISLSMIAAGQAVWFDLISLLPGLDWGLSIQKGLQDAAGLLVVVSPNSMESANVADEIRRALADGKPLFLAIVEAAPLQLSHAPELDLAAHAHSIIDMRGSFDKAFQCLLHAFQSNKPFRDPVPLQRPLPDRFPRHVTEILLASGLFVAAGAWVWVSWLTAGQFPWDLAAARLYFIALTGILLWQVADTFVFLRRRITRERFATHWFYVVTGLLYGVFWQQSHVPDISVNWLIVTMGVAAFLFGFYRLFWSADLIRWKRSDSPWLGPGRRSQLNLLSNRMEQSRRETQHPWDPRPYVYSLTYSSVDEPMARLFRKALNGCINVFENGVSVPPEGPFPPSYWSFLLVTNRLTAAEREAFEASTAPVKLYFVTTPNRIRTDAVGRAGKLQWVDLRSVNMLQIGFLILYLRGLQTARLRYASYYMPTSFDSLKGPQGLAELVHLINLAALSCFACGLLAVVAPSTTASVSKLLPLGLLIGVWQFSMVHELYQRTRTLGQLLTEFAASLVISYFIGIGKLLFHSNYLLLIPAAYLAILVTSISLLAKRWFPIKGCWRPTAESPTHAAIVKEQIPYFALTIATAAYLFANRS